MADEIEMVEIGGPGRAEPHAAPIARWRPSRSIVAATLVIALAVALTALAFTGSAVPRRAAPVDTTLDSALARFCVPPGACRTEPASPEQLGTTVAFFDRVKSARAATVYRPNSGRVAAQVSYLVRADGTSILLTIESARAARARAPLGGSDGGGPTMTYERYRERWHLFASMSGPPSGDLPIDAVNAWLDRTALPT